MADTSKPPRRVGLLLLEGFNLIAYTLLVEPFRFANLLANKDLYFLTHLSLTGKPVNALSGAGVLADVAVGDPVKLDTLFVLGGDDSTEFNDRRTFAWLRRLARAGVQVGCVSSGSFVLARAGLLDGHRFTIHWDFMPTFLEAFPTMTPEEKLFVVDRGRLTCAGGTAILDMTIDMIEREQGHELAEKISDWILYSKPRSANDAQRTSLRERYGISNAKLLKVLAHMEAHVTDTEGRETLTKIAGLSSRQLDRLFEAHLKTSLGETYLRIRLDHANVLLHKTGMSVAEVAAACGFASSSHFSRCFKQRYGLPPRASR